MSDFEMPDLGNLFASEGPPEYSETINSIISQSVEDMQQSLNATPNAKLVDYSEDIDVLLKLKQLAK